MPLDLTVRYKRWQTRANINGQPVRLLADSLPRRRIGLDAARSTCELPLVDVPAYNGDETAFVDIGWNGLWERFFTGFVRSPSAAEPRIARSVTLVDDLGKLERSLDADITWNNEAFDDAVRDILDAVGITKIGTIYDPGLTLGGNYPITIKTSETPSQVFQQLMEYGGTRAIVYPDGYVHVLNISGIASEIPAALPNGDPTIYAYAREGDELGILGSSWLLETSDLPINNVTITGPTRSDGVTPTGAVQLDSAGKPWSMQMRFVQTSADAATIAQRELNRKAVPRKVVQFEAPFNPYLLPGQSIGFRDPKVGITKTTPAFVVSVDANGTRMQVTLWIGAHPVNGFDPLPDPIAAFSLIIEQQPIVVAGSTVTRYFVQCQDLSVAPASAIVSRAWTATGATPSSASTENPLFVYSDLSGKSITLVVENLAGQQGTVTKAVYDANVDKILQRQLLIAEGSNGLAVLNNGAFTSYTRSSRSCTAVPTFNEIGALYSGWDDGAVYKVLSDFSGIEAVATMTGGGQINTIFVNEASATDILVGAGQKLHRSTNGTSFTLLSDLGATINDVQSSPSNPNEIRVAVGQHLKISFNGGISFSNAIVGANGTTARMMATAPWGHACVFTGGAAAADAVKFEEGYAVDWSAVASPPTALRTVTPLLETEGFVVGDGAGKLYKLLWDGSGFDATDITTISGTPSIDDGIRDGTLSALHFYATDDGTKKLVSLATVYDVKDNPALQVGYGKLKAPTPNVRVELVSPTFSIASGGVWHYVPGSGWTLKSTGYPAMATWAFWITVNPFDQDEWIVLLNTFSNQIGFKRSGTTILCGDVTTSPLWRTDDAGGSWSPITLTMTDVNPANTELYQVEFSQQEAYAGEWIVSGMANNNPVFKYGYIARGSGLASTFDFVDTDWVEIRYHTPGLAGDVVVAEDDSPGGGTSGRFGLQERGNNDIQTMLSYTTTAFQIDKMPGLSRAIVGVNKFATAGGYNKAFYSADYRNMGGGNGVFTFADPEPASFVTCHANGKAYLGGENASVTRRHNILELSKFGYTVGVGVGWLETPLTATTVSAPEFVGFTRSGRRFGEAMAARIPVSSGAGGQDFWTSASDGTGWVRLTGPASTLANRLDVIERDT